MVNHGHVFNSYRVHVTVTVESLFGQSVSFAWLGLVGLSFQGTTFEQEQANVARACVTRESKQVRFLVGTFDFKTKPSNPTVQAALMSMPWWLWTVVEWSYCQGNFGSFNEDVN